MLWMWKSNSTPKYDTIFQAVIKEWQHSSGLCIFRRVQKHNKTLVDISCDKSVQQLLSAPSLTCIIPLSHFLLCHIPHKPPSPIFHLCSCALRYFGIHSFCDYGLVCIFDKRADDRRLHSNMKLVPRIREQTWLLGVYTYTHRTIPLTTSHSLHSELHPSSIMGRGKPVFSLIVSKYCTFLHLMPCKLDSLRASGYKSCLF